MTIANIKFNSFSNAMEPPTCPVYVMTSYLDIVKAVRVGYAKSYSGEYTYRLLDTGELIPKATCWAYLDKYSQEDLERAKEIVEEYGD